MLRSSMVLALVAAVALVLSAPGSAITGGEYDGDGHPYVAFADNGVTACSGTLLSPTVLLTAAHCFSGSASSFGANSETGAPIVRISFDPNLINTPRGQRVWFFGTYYGNPEFALGAAGQAPSHDVAVVVLTASGCSVPAGQKGTCGAVPASATLGQYGALPARSFVSGLGMNTPVEIAGFGVQDFTRGGGPCGGPCTPRFGSAFTRYSATTRLITSSDALGDTFIKLHANDGGVCFGDSGGPVLVAGTHTILGVNSFDANDLCSGVTYSYRVDTAAALDWIAATVAAHGASL